MSLRVKGRNRGKTSARSSRELALIALSSWRKKERFADAILADLLASTDLIAADRGFVTELFYGVLRNLTLLDFWIDAVRSGPVKNEIRDFLRLGFYQLFLLKTPEHAAVYETVNLSKDKTRSFVNALLRKAIRDKEEMFARTDRQNLSVRYSHPQFLVGRWLKNFGTDNTLSLCQSNNQPAPIYGRINQVKIGVPEFFLKYREAKVVTQHKNFARLTEIPRNALVEGHCYIQDPSTAPACLLVNPKPGEAVLDACAAPGGKTAYLAEFMENQGTIIACDRDADRIKMLQSNLSRLGVTNARLVTHDWIRDEARALPISSFDKILVDAPCSNTGVMRRRVDLRWRLRPRDFIRMQQEQLRILGSIIPLLKEDGVLVYSTCSIEPEENEELIGELLERFPRFRCVERVSLFPFREGFDGAFAAKLVQFA